jgi:hypothetical protein
VATHSPLHNPYAIKDYKSTRISGKTAKIFLVYQGGPYFVSVQANANLSSDAQCFNCHWTPRLISAYCRQATTKFSKQMFNEEAFVTKKN